MANTSCVDSEIFYQKMGEVKASKTTKASKITLFIDDNFYNDAVTWLETRNEDSKDRTNLTSQDVAPKRACYSSLIKSTKEIRTPQQEKSRNTTKI